MAGRIALPVALAVAAAAYLSPAWTQVATYDLDGANLIAYQQAADQGDGAEINVLIARIKALGGGRVYAGTKANWGRDYIVGYVPVYSVLVNNDIDNVGMWLNTQSLSSDVEVRFNETSPAQYDLFGIRYLLLPGDHPPPVPAQLLQRSGRHTLWQVDGGGYFAVVDTIGPPIVADRTNIGRQVGDFVLTAGAPRGYPTVAFSGAPAAAPTLTGPLPSTPPGAIVSSWADLDDGAFGAAVRTDRVAVVLLKETFDPRWRVTVDGVDLAPEFIAPSYVGRTVPVGLHTVRFRYEPIGSYPLLLALGVAALLALWVLDRPERVRRWLAQARPSRYALRRE